MQLVREFSFRITSADLMSHYFSANQYTEMTVTSSTASIGLSSYWKINKVSFTFLDHLGSLVWIHSRVRWHQIADTGPLNPTYWENFSYLIMFSLQPVEKHLHSEAVTILTINFVYTFLITARTHLLIYMLFY